jgi:hypothetical protein
MQTTKELEKAQELFKILEMRGRKSVVKDAVRFICIQELLRDLKN